MPTAKKSRPATPTKTKPRAAATATPSDEIDRQLARYQSMRDFAVTAEPSGKTGKPKAAAKQGLPFVIQKHAASHLHYDFRLGWNGVLKSWACAKDPSYFPGDRRLAVQVEDHPMEYGGFEGIIPQGQYGGGTVMLWDQGTWEPQPGHEDIDAGLRSGSLKFTLHGTKMHGHWTLVRMGGKAANEKKPNWLLIKEHDEFEASEKSRPITDSEPNSVVTQRSLEEIAASEDHVWNSKDTAKGSAWFRNEKKETKPGSKEKSSGKAKPQSGKLALPDLAEAPKETFPGFIEPQLATEAESAPDTTGWLHELKLDGYRIQAHKQGSAVQLLTRSGLDWTHRMQPLATALAALPIGSAILDGEVVVLNADGTTNFADLQAAFPTGNRAAANNALTYFAFDCLHAEGRNLRKLPLLERKAILEKLLADAPDSLRYSEHLETSGDLMFHKACELHAEGIISKKATAPYLSGRTSNWLKLKCIHEQEFVIAGFTLPAKGRAGLPAVGALLLGYYDDQKRLIYAGRTGTGFTQKTHKLLRTQLEGLRMKTMPFHNPPAEARHGAIWVEPKLVAQVRFATWTATNLLRQASFQGLREDKPAAEVRKETTILNTRSGVEVGFSPPLATAKRRASAPAIPAHAPIRLTHPDKVVDPASGLTKQQLADYYWAIAPHLLPHIVGRPLSLVRCPEGSTKPCFFQKHTTTMLPPGVESVAVPDKKTGKPEPYITLSTPEALAGLAQMGVLEIHPWGSCNDDLEHPDRLIIDLDPDAAITWPVLAAAANEVRQRFKKLGLESFLKSTGGKGLHIVVPVTPEHDWPTVKQFTHNFVLALEKANPRLYLTKMSKAARKDRIYLDYLRNERGATAVAAYSPRARAGATVSVPLPWSALKLPTPPQFTVSDFPTWLPTLKPNPWKALPTTHQRLVL